MTIEFVLEIFFALKGTHDNYNDNENASHLSVIRLRVLEDPIVKFHSQELSISKHALETLEKALQVVKQFFDDYNESSIWHSCMRAIRSGKYAQDFAHANQMIDRALQAV
ncbi:MAG: hypothetical protein EBT93_04540, partial [Alphaproteobacteria bacterium]|nr:hypothetical protein [Alphaproteobacteria bacterium]